jgi:citronellyl-CoA dehydrogenase
MATPALARFGSDELRREFLAPAISRRICRLDRVSEPGAGSDVAAITTRAVKDGDDYVINGSKMWITNSARRPTPLPARQHLRGRAAQEQDADLRADEAKGVSVAKKLKKLGMWSSDTAQLYFDEVRVPQRYRIGEEGMGFTYQMQQFQEERLYAAAQWTALDRILRETIAYTRERQAFGQSILDNQYVHFRLAELKTEIEALRALVHDAAAKLVAGEDVTMLASMAKLKVGRLGREVADGCLQFWGGMGYVWESNVSRACATCVSPPSAAAPTR